MSSNLPDQGNRTARLIAALGVSQPQLAAWLRVRQSTVSRMVGGQEEAGPVSRLLDQLEAVIADRGVEAARDWVKSGALAPDAPAPRPSHIMQSGFGSFL